ncbi:MAG: (d)CMP kinase [Desulfobacteraceae bacterium]|nr:MAG: (d)CMP kinase [Desulfobacteraceae bacterium]
MAHKIITIDGPAGAGKTTVSKALAKALGCIYVDTGALYRGVAYEIRNRRINWKDEAVLDTFLSDIDLQFTTTGDDCLLTSSGTDISGVIRTGDISMLASDVSAHPLVRQALLDIQRNIGKTRTAVFEGRDMGTVVFPNADCKFFLTADLKIRSRRRYDETQPGNNDLETIEKEMALRDHNDSIRKESPLKPADDAVYIDSTHLSVDQVVTKMIAFIG